MRVTDTTLYPFRTVGMITYCIAAGDCGYSCTGTLISPTLVMTAAHCLFEISGGTWHTDMTFTPASSSATDAPFGTLSGAQIVYLFVPEVRTPGIVSGLQRRVLVCAKGARDRQGI